jgi:hypothetical protein
MSYLHDIFISYGRELQWTPWTRDYLKRELNSHLYDKRGGYPDIFVDERIEVGEDWVDGLGDHLARSKIVVAVFSTGYFSSDWCRHELDLMLHRTGGKVGLFAPIVVEDCEKLPDPVSRAQATDFKKYRLSHMNPHGQTYEDFGRAVRALTTDIAKRIAEAPVFDPAWIEVCTTRFRAVHAEICAGKQLPPIHYDPAFFVRDRGPQRLII